MMIIDRALEERQDAGKLVRVAMERDLIASCTILPEACVSKVPWLLSPSLVGAAHPGC